MTDKIINRNDDAVAYSCDGLTLSYKNLFEASVKYGELLKKQGTGPVIIYGHKSVDTFMSIFACLNSGRAYIPVDIFTPVERIKKIIEYTDTQLILTDSKLDITAVEQLSLDGLKKYQDEDIKNVENDIAYIIFTSGSTGNPKGVPIKKNNLLNFISWISALDPLSDYKNVTVLNQASFSFDLSVADVFYSVANGHKLVALTRESQKDYNNIFEVIKNNNINVFAVTPTFIKLCLINKDFNGKNFPSVKCIYFCGEQLEGKTVKTLLDRFPDLNVINAYGPTEATSAVSAVKITKDMLDSPLLPCGKVGKFATEICIESDEIVLKGKSVFSGYIGNEKGGFYQQGNINCFRTGDMGYIKDNLLYCKGRKDSQVKYKSYRIELSDIENNLYKIQGITQCAVVAEYKDRFTVKLIKAFVVSETELNTNHIKKELAKLLPEYMIPKVICQVEKLPVNCNGKIDRKRLESYA